MCLNETNTVGLVKQQGRKCFIPGNYNENLHKDIMNNEVSIIIFQHKHFCFEWINFHSYKPVLEVTVKNENISSGIV